MTDKKTKKELTKEEKDKIGIPYPKEGAVGETVTIDCTPKWVNILPMIAEWYCNVPENYETAIKMFNQVGTVADTLYEMTKENPIIFVIKDEDGTFTFRQYDEEMRTMTEKTRLQLVIMLEGLQEEAIDIGDGGSIFEQIEEMLNMLTNKKLLVEIK